MIYDKFLVLNSCKAHASWISCDQWRNRRGGGGGAGAECPPPRLLTGKFLLTYRENLKRQEKKEKGGEKKENCKREGAKLKMEGGRVRK